MKESVNVGRGTPFGNPFKVGGYGPNGKFLDGPGSTLPYYREYLIARIRFDPDFARQIRLLEGETLYCPSKYCQQHPETCHVTVLYKIIKELTNVG